MSSGRQALLELPLVGLPGVLHRLRDHGPVCARQPGGGRHHASHRGQQGGTADALTAPCIFLKNVVWRFVERVI